MKKLLSLLIIVIIAGLAFWQKDTLLSIFNPGGTLRIVMNTEATDLSPYSLNRNNLTRTANIYESLVTFDRNLKITPALAASWGNLDETTWEFKLRKGVTFHDGTPFTAAHVVDSFNQAKAVQNSQVSPYLSTIQSVEAVDTYTIRITTTTTDPILLSKLTKVFITHEEAGTGPYLKEEWIPGKILKLTHNENYWGRAPAFKAVEYMVQKSALKRQSDFDDKKTDVLVAVPRDQALELPEENRRSNFALEVNFMMLNLQDELLQEKAIREAIRQSFDPAHIEEIGNHFVRQSTQFVAPGVFGYNSTIEPFVYSEDRPKNLFGNRLEKLELDYLPTYQTLVEYLAKQLRETGFSVRLNPLSPEGLLTKIRNNTSQAYLVGWQAENGDAGDFLDAFIHSKGEFNGGRINNAELDTKIEAARTELDPKVRVGLLQEIMELIDEEVFGVPLFESSHLYAVQKHLKWEPRLDSLVLAAEFR